MPSESVASSSLCEKEDYLCPSVDAEDAPACVEPDSRRAVGVEAGVVFDVANLQTAYVRKKEKSQQWKDSGL